MFAPTPGFAAAGPAGRLTRSAYHLLLLAASAALVAPPDTAGQAVPGGEAELERTLVALPQLPAVAVEVIPLPEVPPVPSAARTPRSLRQVVGGVLRRAGRWRRVETDTGAGAVRAARCRFAHLTDEEIAALHAHLRDLAGVQG